MWCLELVVFVERRYLKTKKIVTAGMNDSVVILDVT
jgi:hypothetical protein